MAESVAMEPKTAGGDGSKATSGQQANKPTKAFNAFQIAQTQFDKVAELSGSGSGHQRAVALSAAGVSFCDSRAHGRWHGTNLPRLPGAAQ